MRSRVALAVLALSLWASGAMAGVIAGTISKGQGYATALGTAGGSTPARGLSDAVVYVEAIPAPVERKLASHGFWIFRSTSPRVVGLVQAKRQFNPHLLAVAAGTRVAFHNFDDVYHSTFSVSAAKRFELGKRSPGRSDTVVFARPGAINLHCDIHPDMVGYVFVTPNHAFAHTDSLGRYRLPNLPPGTYRLHAFHPRWGELQRTAQVPPRGGLTLDVAF